MADEAITSQPPTASPLTVEHENKIDFLRQHGTAQAQNPEEERIFADLAAAGFAKKEGNAYVFTASKDEHDQRPEPPEEMMVRYALRAFGLVVATAVAILIGVELSDWRSNSKGSTGAAVTLLSLCGVVISSTRRNSPTMQRRKQFLCSLLAIGLLLSGGFWYLAREDNVKWTKEEKDNSAHFDRSLDFGKQAMKLVDEIKDSGDAQSLPLILSLVRHALDEGHAVRPHVLAKLHPELPKAFREKYIRCLELWIEALESGRIDVAMNGDALMREFSAWLLAHIKDVHFPQM
jgi:hypothetical protein